MTKLKSWYFESGLTSDQKWVLFGAWVNHAFALGGTVAAIMSWSANHSPGWAAVHGLLGWVYVGYQVVVGW